MLDPAKIGSLPTVFRPDGDGVVTAANSSQVSDGAAAVLVADREAAMGEGFKPRARFLARVAVGDDPTLQLAGVIPATLKALKRAGLTINDIDWIEINEAFATVVLGWAKEMKPKMERVNPWGGAIAHGHPLGATGAGLMAKMLSGPGNDRRTPGPANHVHRPRHGHGDDHRADLRIVGSTQYSVLSSQRNRLPSRYRRHARP